MTDDEKYILEGRARAEAKTLEAELVALREFFTQFTEKLEVAGSSIDSFLSDPSGRFPNGRLKIDQINYLHNDLSSPGFFENATQFMEKTRRLRDLQERIRKF